MRTFLVSSRQRGRPMCDAGRSVFKPILVSKPDRTPQWMASSLWGGASKVLGHCQLRNTARWTANERGGMLEDDGWG